MRHGTKLGRTLPALALLAASASASDALFKVLPVNAQVEENFGSSAALDGRFAVIGTDGGGEYRGTARVFDLIRAEQKLKLRGHDTVVRDYFGRSVAIDGGRVLVGAPGDLHAGANSGSAYLFDVATGAELFKWTAPDAGSQNYFGHAVALSGDLALIGAFGDDDFGTYSGSVYVFDATTGDFLRKLNALDAAPGDVFGISVDIDGTTAIVGASADDDNGSLSGSAYLFDAATGAQLHKLIASDGFDEDSFGAAVAIAGGTAVVGAHQDDDGFERSGSAYLFDVATGTERAKLHSSQPSAFALFGLAVAVAGDQVVVAAPQGRNSGLVQSGRVDVFDAVTGAHVETLSTMGLEARDQLGRAIAMDEQRIVACAPGDDDLGPETGAAYAFCHDCPGVNYCAPLPNSTGQPAAMHACGSSSLADNDLSLIVEPVPNQPYWFFYGANQVSVPFGDGVLCVGGNVTRIRRPDTALGNIADLGVDLGVAGILVPGTLHFQCWYRDPSGGPQRFNLSEATTIDFVP